MDAIPRRLQPEGWAPVPKRKVRAYGEARDERVRIPHAANHMRPAPLNLNKRPPPADVKSQWSPSSVESNGQCENPKDPQVVDIACISEWPRRGATPARTVTPSATSQYSTRQSEVSYGVLDFYLGDRSSLDAPFVPPLTPKDPAMDQFDFGLIHSNAAKPTPSNNLGDSEQALPSTKAGAERQDKPPALVPLSPPLPTESQLASLQSRQKKSYNLFPAVREPSDSTKPTPINKIPPPPLSSKPTNPFPTNPFPTNRAPDPSSPTTAEDKLVTIPLHRAPDSSYRPRKESLPTPPFQTRKDSMHSFRSSSGGTRSIPMRILSNSTTATDRSSSSATATPPHASVSSRWSDDTITSPTAATFRPTAVRGSFSSLLGRGEYPACFFDDDDEDGDDDEEGEGAAALRRKFGWKRSGSLAAGREAKERRRGRFEEKASFGGRLRRLVLCCGR
ncbi:hypothetical protein MBLNU230_g6732t1 [Neophaeotheca triangularis]